MRAPILPGLIAVLCLAGACSEAPPESPPQAKLAPITPILDWSSVARKNAGPKAPARADTAPAQPKTTEPAAPVARAEPDSATRHALFKFLPKDALLVVDVPEVSEMRTAFEESGIARLFDNPEVDEKLAQLGTEFARGLERMREDCPEVAPALDLLPRLKGRMAIAISGLTAETLAASAADMPWIVTVIYDAGEQADRVAEISAPLFASLAKRGNSTLVEKPAPAWGCEIGDARFLLDFERVGNLFQLRAGGRAAVIRELAASRKRVDATSFYTARVATEASNVESLGARELLEVHLQVTSLWEALRGSGNRADTKVLARTGLSQLYGASMAIGRTQQGLAEALTLHSPAGIDLITHVLTGQPMDTTLARCVPGDLPNAGLYSFDGTRVVADLCLMMPSEAQSGLVRALAECRRRTGIDVEKDVLRNLGPTIALATSGFDLVKLQSSRPEVFLAIQVVDAARAQRMLNAIAVASGRSDEVKNRTIDGVRVSSVRVPVGEGLPDFELHWCVCSSVLIVSTRADDIAQAMRDLHQREVANAGLRAALAKAGNNCFAAGFTQGDEGTPDAISLGRRTDAGLELTASDGAAMQSTIFSLFSLGIVSSIAIPRLLELRHDANERAASSTLVVVNDAEIMARMEAFLDEDHDGRGESLYLPELCGAIPLRGSSKTLPDPWLDGGFRWLDGGIGEKSGYRFRVDLLTEETAAIAGESDPHAFAIDVAEACFLAYAWPADFTRGSEVFVFDSEGGLYSSDNRGEQQRYAGDRVPEMGAHWMQDGSGRPGAATRYVGSDGGTWLRLRSIEDRETGTR